MRQNANYISFYIKPMNKMIQMIEKILLKLLGLEKIFEPKEVI